MLMKPGPATETSATSASSFSLAMMISASARGLVPSGFASTIAALVATSPWLASRGGSTPIRPKSSSDRFSLHDINLFEGVLNSGFEVGEKVHRTLPRIGCAAGLCRAAGAAAAYRKSGSVVKQPPVGADCIGVGHAGQIIADMARLRRHRPGRRCGRPNSGSASPCGLAM